MSDESAWVIECNQGPTPEYWTGRGPGEQWSRNNADALRFARKIDAEVVLYGLVPPRHCTRVSEHGWIDREQP